MVETHLTTTSTSISPTSATVNWDERDTPSLVRDAIIDDLSVESKPTQEYVLPERDTFVAAVSAVEQYLYEYGAAVVAELHLDGLAAPITYTGSGNMYTVFDNSTFTDIVNDTVQETSGVDATEELVSAVTFAFELESKRRFQTNDDVSIDDADWPVMTGKQTDNVVPIVVETPHPLVRINTHHAMYDRALAVCAGVQRLTNDVDSVVGQRDMGAYVLYRALVGNGVSELQARQTTMSWYGVEEDAFYGLLETVDHEVYDAVHDEDYDFEHRYYMPEHVADQIV